MKKVFGWYFKANLAYRILGALVIGSIIGMIVPKGVILFGNTTLLSVIAPFWRSFYKTFKDDNRANYCSFSYHGNKFD